MFDVVYADPPWSFSDKGSRIAPDNEACADGYDTMDIEDICSMPVREYVKDNSALFLWTTWTHILSGEAQQVVKAWGFDSKVVVPWVKLSDTPGESSANYKDFPSVEWFYEHGMKIQIGAGHYVRACTEPLIIAARGSMTVPPALRVPGVIAAPRTSHSAKPPMLRELIERCYPEAKYMELFARRQPPRERWTFLGNQSAPVE